MLKLHIMLFFKFFMHCANVWTAGQQHLHGNKSTALRGGEIRKHYKTI